MQPVHRADSQAALLAGWWCSLPCLVQSCGMRRLMQRGSHSDAPSPIRCSVTSLRSTASSRQSLPALHAARSSTPCRSLACGSSRGRQKSPCSRRSHPCKGTSRLASTLRLMPWWSVWEAPGPDLSAHLMVNLADSTRVSPWMMPSMMSCSSLHSQGCHLDETVSASSSKQLTRGVAQLCA